MKDKYCEFCETKKEKLVVYAGFKMCEDCKKDQIIQSDKCNNGIIQRLKSKDKDNISPFDLVINTNGSHVFFPKCIQEKAIKRYEKIRLEFDEKYKYDRAKAYEVSRHVYLD